MLSVGENDATGKPQLTGDNIESAFSVVNQEITPKKADLATCKSDNDYLLSALKEKNIELINTDYDVVV
ncbi:MAG: hypothetical protein L0Z73_13510, partial [Gammaproteobacteria bacterium]|nr:hypothetical protein [Gammaproteobacteria bacterium]